MRLQQKLEVKRFPLVGPHNTRIIDENVGESSSSGIVGLGIVGIMIVGSIGSINRDQRFVNAIPDVVKNPVTGAMKYYVYKRPGLETDITPAAGNIGTAIKVWTSNGNVKMTAFGGTNSTIYNEAVSIGAIVGTARAITETFVGTTATLVIPSSNSRTWYYPAAGALTEIVDVDYPGNAGFVTTGTVVHMDGYSFIQTTDGKVWNSDLNSISDWSATGFIQANAYPDQGVGLARYRNLLVAFGKETIEFFKNVGNPLGSPLQKENDGLIRIGAAHADAICQLENNVAWVAASHVGSNSVYMFDGFTPKRISTNTIDTQLALRSQVQMSVAKLFGKTLIFLVIGQNTFVYCVEDDLWHEWNSPEGVLWHKVDASSAAASSVYFLSQDVLDGKIYKINQSLPVFQDDGTNFTMSITTSKVDFDNENRKVLNRLTVVSDVNTTASTLDISWSDDDYNTFATARSVDLTSNRKYLSNCGTFRRRAFRLANDENCSLRLEALDLTVTQRR